MHPEGDGLRLHFGGWKVNGDSQNSAILDEIAAFRWEKIFSAGRRSSLAKRKTILKLAAPKHSTFWIAIGLGGISLVLQIIPNFGLRQCTFVLAIAGLTLPTPGNLIQSL